MSADDGKYLIGPEDSNSLLCWPRAINELMDENCLSHIKKETMKDQNLELFSRKPRYSVAFAFIEDVSDWQPSVA